MKFFRLSLAIVLNVTLLISNFPTLAFPGGFGGGDVIVNTPFAPGSVSVPSTSTSGNFNLTWSNVNGETHYRWREYNNGTWSVWNSSPANSTTASLVNRATGTYKYEVQSCNYDAMPMCSISRFSNEIQVTRTVTPATPGTITISDGSNSSDGAYQVSWGASSGAPTHYEYQESVDSTWGTWVSTNLALNTQISGNGDGVYAYRVRACNTAGCSAVRTSSNVTVTLPTGVGGDGWKNTAGSVPDAAWNGDTPVLNGDVNVGALEGSGGVSGGAATYNIPIVIPPGRAGMQPSISLNYSSRSGNGVAGVGWSLSAGSSIHRCSATAAQDKYGKGVTYSASDKLCLDGQRLIQVAGSVYGASGAQYRTETDSFAKIVQSGDFDSSSNFTVYHKDGRISKYGLSSNSQHKAGGKTQIMSWAIAEVQDRSKNTITYDYFNYPNGENLLSAVHYTGTNGSDGDRHVRMVYENRPDLNRSYMAGGLTVSTKRLQKVQTQYQSQTIREYKLTYDTSDFTSRSIVKEIQECASGNCLPATKVTTYQPSYEWDDKDSSSSANLALNVVGDVQLSDKVIRKDLNGDGVMEVIYTSKVADSNSTSGFLFTHKIYSKGTSPDYQLKKSWTSPSAALTVGLSVSGDLNGDGITDFLTVNSNNQVSIIQFDENFNADSYSTNIVLPTSNDQRTTFALDFNNDGFQDIAYVSSNSKVYYFQNKATGTLEFESASMAKQLDIYTYTGGSAPIVHTENASFMDIDGDGHLDLVRTFRNSLATEIINVDFGTLVNGQWRLGVAKDASQLGLPSNLRDNQHLFADLNGDGLTDFVRPVQTSSGHDWRVRINQGNRAFAVEKSLNNSTGIHSRSYPVGNGTYYGKAQPLWTAIKVGDFDNDGVDELLVPTHSDDNFCVFYSGRTVHSGSIEPNEVEICNDQLHVDKVGYTTGNGHMAIDWSYLDFRRFSWSIIDFKETVTGPVFDKTIANVVKAPLSIQFFDRDTGSYSSPLETSDIDNDGLIDFSYHPMKSWQYNGNISIAGTDHYDALIIADFKTDSPPITSGYFEQLSLIGKNLAEGKLADTAEVIENGLSVGHSWHYAPLSKHIDRPSSSKDFYDVPQSYNERYAFDSSRQYFYFTSSMYVVSDSFQSDGLGGFNQKQYSYREAVYNRMGRGFQGFRSVIVDDLSDTNAANHIRSVSDFHQKFPLAGKLEQTRTCLISSGGEDCSVLPINKSIYDWDLWRDGVYKATVYNATTDFSTQVLEGTSTSNRYWVAPRTQKEYSYETDSAHNSAMTVGTNWLSEKYQYFQFSPSYRGCPTVTLSRYQESGGANKTETVTNNYYDADDTGVNWWLCKPSYQTVTTKAVTGRGTDYAGVESGSDIQKQVKTTYVFDAAHRKPKQITTEATEGQGTAAGLHSVINTTYNSYGLPTSVVSDGEHYTGADMTDRSVTTTYTADGYFVNSVTNSKAHVTTTEVDPIHGQATQVIDPNGQVTTMTYDAFGRVHSTKLPGEPTQYTAYWWCNGVNGGTAWCAQYGSFKSKYRILNRAKGKPDTYTYFDMFNRNGYGITRNFNNNHWYYSRTLFNNKGQTIIESTYNGGDSYSWQNTYYDSYDALGRLTKKRTPQSDGGHLPTTYQYDGFVTNINAGGLEMARKYNGLGQLVWTKDAHNNYTRYAYDGTGNPITLQDANGNPIYAKYNALGHKEYVDDPNMGKKFFWYNTFGEVEKEKDANLTELTYSYDTLGRMTQRWTNGTRSGYWYWDNGNVANYKGLLRWSYDGPSTVNARVKYHYYGKTIGGKLYETQTKYRHNESGSYTDYDILHYVDNNFGRPKGMKYQTTGLTLAYDYNPQGYLSKIKNANGGYVYQEIKDLDNHGKITKQLKTNGLLTESAIDTSVPMYHPATGQMLSIRTATTYGDELRHELTYTYDDFSNLEMQTVRANGVTNSEDYDYDGLHRLVLSQRTINNGTPTTIDPIEYSYDPVGNFTKKGDYVTSYAYGNADKNAGGNAGPNAARSITKTSGGTAVYEYDNNGNMKSGDGRTITYNEFNKPTSIKKGVIESQFSYGADLMRYKQVKEGLPGGVTETTYYIDKMLEKVETKVNLTTTKTVYKHYIGDVAIQTKTVTGSSSEWDIRFTHRDRLGSVITLTDDLGNVTEHRSYDAFGKPRKGDFGDLTRPTLFEAVGAEPFTDRGFTDHEHLDDAELIHMNGRAYDYNLGRFLSVDPFVHGVGNSQGINPYTYIMNNPLAGTDPTGYKPILEEDEHCSGDRKHACDFDNSLKITMQYARNNGNEVQQQQGGNTKSKTSEPGETMSLQPEGTVGKGNIPIGSSRHKVLATVAENPILSIFAGSTITLLINMDADVNGGEGVAPGAIQFEAQSNLLISVLSAGMLPPSTEALIPDSSGALSPIAPELLVAGPAVNTSKNIVGARNPNVGLTPRTGPKGVDSARHNANVTVRDIDGNITTHTRIVSGNMTPAEKALGFPKNTLASHTEARAVTQFRLFDGKSMTITGHKPPCPSCKGYMNREAKATGSKIRYQWRENGSTRTWETK